MEKINIAEILKDCPKGTKLYTTVWGDVEFIGYNSSLDLIKVSISGLIDSEKLLYGDGSFAITGECILFPSKENRDWSKFQRFKNGDILTDIKGNICIYKCPMYYDKQLVDFYCGYRIIDETFVLKLSKSKHFGFISQYHLSTEEEKQKLFDAIKERGYKWNSEKKELEKLVEPKFKVGDRIKSKNIHTNYLNDNHIFTITEISKGKYWSNRLAIEYIEKQDDWELVPDKFDITTLKPFNKVLVRCSSLEKWHIQFFEKYNRELGAKYPFICLFNNKYSQCVPYEGNEYLLDTTDDCDEYFKTWK